MKLHRVSRRHAPTALASAGAILVLVVLGAVACTVDGGDEGMSCNCSVGGVSEPGVYGPYDHEPTWDERDDAPDVISADASQIYFLWGHPDGSDAANLNMRVTVVAAPPLPPDMEMMNEQLAVGGTDMGWARIDAPPQGLFPGTYRVELSLDEGMELGSIEFEVSAGSGRQ